MGTHPIFESDFDCLTDKMGRSRSRDRKKKRRRSRSRDRHDRSRSRDRGKKSDRNAILIRSRSNSPDVKIEIEQGHTAKTDKHRDQPKRFESVSSSKNESDVVLVDEIATSAYAKTFYKSKELEAERMRLKDERERMEKEKEERERLLQPEEPNEDEAMMAMMGFSGFETTQNKKVEGNDVIGVSRTQKQRKY